jgi:hypothetical protein
MSDSTYVSTDAPRGLRGARAVFRTGPGQVTAGMVVGLFFGLMPVVAAPKLVVTGYTPQPFVTIDQFERFPPMSDLIALGFAGGRQ